MIASTTRAIWAGCPWSELAAAAIPGISSTLSRSRFSPAAVTGEIALTMCQRVSRTVNTTGVTTTHAGIPVMSTAAKASTENRRLAFRYRCCSSRK